MKTRIGNIRARRAGIDAVRGALFGANNNSRAANDNNIGRARRGGPGATISGSPPGSGGASAALRRAA